MRLVPQLGLRACITLNPMSAACLDTALLLKDAFKLANEWHDIVHGLEFVSLWTHFLLVVVVVVTCELALKNISKHLKFNYKKTDRNAIING